MEAETAPPPETTEAVEAAPQVKQVEAAAVVEEAPAADNGDDNKPEEAVEPEESVSNGNGTSVSEPDDKPESEAVEAAEVTENADIEEPEEEKMDTSEAADEAPKEEGDEERKDEPEESKAEDEAGKDESEDKKEEVPADSFDQMLSASDKKDTTTTEDDKKDDEENKDSFDKMLSAGGDDDTAEKKDEDSEDKKDDADVSEEKKDDVDSEDKKDDADSEEKKDDGEEKKDDAAATTISGDPFDDSTVEPNKDDEVITITSEKAVTDEKYYEELNPEELAWLKEHVPGIDSVYTKLQCTTCSKIVDPVISTAKGVNRHPHLGICICQPCRQFYGDGDWPRSEDGDEYCRMCGQGGDILLCDKCPNAFCKKCLQRNLGSRALREITKAEEWNCLVCDPSPLHTLKALYYCVYISQVEIKERREKDREAARERERSRKQKSTGVTNKEKQALVKSPQNFLGKFPLFFLLASYSIDTYDF
jgi:chemotaxis protein histidine kinase CheA